MKSQFLLTLLTLSGLLQSATGAFATTPKPAPAATDLSQTIADLVDIGDRHLLTAAIDRALLAQRATNHSQPLVSGKVKAPEPIINGRIINPRHRDNTDRPLINGTVLANPQPEVQEGDKPLINGIIVKPQTDR